MVNPNPNNLNVDPSTLSLQEKMQLFERATEGRGIPRPLSVLNIFPGLNPPSKKPETSNSDNNPSSIDGASHMTTSTPLQHQLVSSKSSSFNYWNSFQKKNTKKLPTHHFSSDNLHAPQLRHENFQFQQQQQQQHPPHHQLLQHKPVPSTSSLAAVSSNSDEKKKDMEKVFHDLDTFIEKELNEIQVRKRISQLEKVDKVKEVDKNSDEKFYATLRILKDEVREIKENQKEFENKIQRHSQMQSNLLSTRKKLEYGTSSSIDSIQSVASGMKKKDSSSSISSKGKMKAPPPPPPRSSVQYSQITVSPPRNKKAESELSGKNLKEKISELPLSINQEESDYSLGNERSREEKISRLESEVYKAETLMMKINRVLENVGKIDEHNIDSIISIERHYLVASTRFQSALSELRKMNENVETHQPPFNRKGKLVIRDIMLEVKSAYFQRKIPTKNEYLLVMIKYDDRVMASNAVRITNDIRIVRFPECFSIPETYADFEMRLEIFGTTFWRKTNTVRETMLKKYGFVTFTLADTGKKHKRFNMIEVMQAENVPIRSKILMRITQKITAGVQFRGLLFVKIRETWYETSTHLNGHILEISFKSFSHSSVTQSRETILLDLYNFDSNAVIPVDTRVSKRPYAFSLKFNHYVDVANFYLMAAADSPESYAEWVSAINKVLVLIK